jgi:hypothetical protein
MRSKLIGAGLVAGAAWVARNRLREPAPLNSSYTEAPTQVLIVGGGFGGLAAARALARTLGESQDVGVALLVFPRLALRISGFETRTDSEPVFGTSS